MALSPALESLFLNMEIYVPQVVDLVDSPEEPPRKSENEDPFSKYRTGVQPTPRPQVVIDSFPAEIYPNKTCAMLADETLFEVWKRHQTKLSLLSKAARRILSQLASTSESERHSSQFRLTVPYHRSLLKGETINALLKYHNVLHYE